MWQWEHFFKVSGQLMRNVPYYPCLGNHENDARLYFDFFSLPGNERYYSFDRGVAHFVVLDTAGPEIPPTNQAGNPQQEARFAEHVKHYWEQQMAWLKGDLAAYDNAKHVFVFFHHPLYSIMKNRQQGTKEMRERFGTIFQDYKVTAVFTGHDHHYHRAVAGGIPFVTTGGGGANTYETDAIQPETLKYARVHHFVRVEVGPERAVARAIDVNGQTIDEFEMPARVAAAAR